MGKWAAMYIESFGVEGVANFLLTMCSVGRLDESCLKGLPGQDARRC